MALSIRNSNTYHLATCLLGITFLVTTFSVTAATVPIVPAKRPFPQHVVYATGTIKPNHVTQATRDLVTQSYYKAWKTEYLKKTAACGADRYFVHVGKGADTNPDAELNPDTLTVSEAHGYGMLIFAWMAGYDANAKTYFDGMLRYWKDHQARSGPGLMAWNQTKLGCKNVTKKANGQPIDGSISATDGDLDIGYALLLADKQWGSSGKYNYRAEAIKVINAILKRETNPVTYHITLGDWVNSEEPNFYYGTRSSDFTISHLRAFQVASNDPRWANVISATYKIIDRIQRLYSPATGLVPDFIESINSGAKPAVGLYLEDKNDGSYFNNACRTPWRVAMDFLLYGEKNAQAAVNKINVWVKRKTSSLPSRIIDGYKLSGAVIGTENELYYVAPLGPAAMVSASNQAWLNALWIDITNRKISDSLYYGNTLKMLALITMSGNAWKP